MHNNDFKTTPRLAELSPEIVVLRFRNSFPSPEASTQPTDVPCHLSTTSAHGKSIHCVFAVQAFNAALAGNRSIASSTSEGARAPSPLLQRSPHDWGSTQVP
ncbi:hypothetical protein D9611_005317 [Ephemerocybe angulata]|uniref:Uncharacterized protein n=1 Tax=Ephemerocybe angulata TaxID=980116 RepID=A0A8H5BZT9_9AGAR|nr:hypothetical protein D9611_005317 [Tulosesus angulatus]